MKNDLIYLDTYILQQDMRIRLPKSILSNLSVEKGKSKFSIYIDRTNNRLILQPDDKMEDNGGTSK
ncbi:AbrB/MazE/SpoVT family DNA-binding domain-containing protein [Ruminococcus sp.]|uniref:AbrB/MazE/SpoVT family DNA-binding domain-containing protein n=1 Tax=Ruminococcus sp. TaxID=41978 RepID=UPI0025D7E801|nr:AbrB/MazE/SpoVT family DNA-binding domain-containing protein [Ruminococcus sp.]MBQ6253023.1 AbrB/MazE/SpoVT family DNA-binding domain-containing protein [Ruminococcus sp.]